MADPLPIIDDLEPPANDVEAYGGDDADAWWDDQQADAVEERAERAREARREPGRQMTWTW